MTYETGIAGLTEFPNFNLAMIRNFLHEGTAKPVLTILPPLVRHCQTSGPYILNLVFSPFSETWESHQLLPYIFRWQTFPRRLLAVTYWRELFDLLSRPTDNNDYREVRMDLARRSGSVWLVASVSSKDMVLTEKWKFKGIFNLNLNVG